MVAALHPDLFRTLLGRHAAGVVIVTAAVAGRGRAGFTATSFTSVSLEPPLVSFCIDHGSSSWPVVGEAEHLGIHFLARTDHHIARAFAARGADRFSNARWQAGPHGVPVLSDPDTVLVCRTEQRVTAGDHVIVLAEPLVALCRGERGTPLIYHMGRYLSADPTAQRGWSPPSTPPDGTALLEGRHVAERPFGEGAG
ncbi:flavin reductase family protein [Nonomuraea antimicrobica]|uniref:Flavin reductase family protein n=1 Tax=Nonomuraea antimicrobica TaxID=561173 RepID=A0ABP7B3W4_9ACTN